MTRALLDDQPGYSTTDVPPGWEQVRLETHSERRGAESQARFEACRRAGRPYIEYHPASATIRYVYFDRSRPPSRELIDEIDALAWSYKSLHYHVLRGHLFQSCLDDSAAIAYQGRCKTISGVVLSPEQAESFASELARLLPRFDRPAAVNSLVDEAISAGYFTDTGDWPYGDDELEGDAREAYRDWCKGRHRPWIALKLDEAYFACDLFDRVLNGHGAAAVNALAGSVGLAGECTPGSSIHLDAVDSEAPLVFSGPEQVRSFVTRLTEILMDPRSYDASRA